MTEPSGAAPAVTLSDEVVLLRPWVRSEASFIARASRDPEIERYNLPQQSLEEAVEVVESFGRNWQRFAASRDPSGVSFVIVNAASGELAGQCGVDEWSSEDVAQIGYWLAPEARGRGFATRAVVLLAGWLFGLGAARVFVTVVAGNEASAAVARRAGFSYEGTLRAQGLWRGQRRDLDVFALLPHDWTGESEQ